MAFLMIVFEIGMAPIFIGDYVPVRWHDSGQEGNVEGETGFNVDLDSSRELAGTLTPLHFDPMRAHPIDAAGQALAATFRPQRIQAALSNLAHDERMLMRLQNS